MSDAGQEVRDRHKLVWSLGDYSAVAERLQPIASRLAEALGLGPGRTLLDVGAGTGNLAVEAARKGATVIASDLTPHLIEQGKARSEDEGLAIEWHEADAENLPFPDDSFDAVGSVMGAIFAPHADAVAAEMMRVAKPGGVVGLTAWPPGGYTGRTFALSSRFMPPPPEGVDSPLEWGDPEVARSRFAPFADEVAIVPDNVTWESESAEASRREWEESAPPVVAAKMFLPPDSFEELMRGQQEIDAELNRATDGRVVLDVEYLMVVARKNS